MNGLAEPGGSLDAVNVGGADAGRFCGGASDLDRYGLIENTKNKDCMNES